MSLQSSLDYIKEQEADIEGLRALSLEERGQLLEAVCRDAAVLTESRARMGLPPAEPAPWPRSTWEFLARQAQRVRREAGAKKRD